MFYPIPKWRCFYLCGMNLKQLKVKKVCPSCLRKEHKGECPPATKKYRCGTCGFSSNATKLHVKCKSKPDTTSSEEAQSVPSPPQQDSAGVNNRRHKVAVKRDFAWRSPGGKLTNPNPMGSSLELVDMWSSRPLTGVSARYVSCTISSLLTPAWLT